MTLGSPWPRSSREWPDHGWCPNVCASQPGWQRFPHTSHIANVALHIEAVHMEDRKLCGHRAGVSPFERLLTKYAWAVDCINLVI